MKHKKGDFMKIYELTSKHIDDILFCKFTGETDATIGKHYNVSAKTIGNWLKQDIFIDRCKEIVKGLREISGIQVRPQIIEKT